MPKKKMNDKKMLRDVGLKIKAIRQKNKISQQDLAASCNFEKSNMCRIEAGNSNITLKTLGIIAQSLGVSMSELIDIKDDYKKQIISIFLSPPKE